jgi:hypothetical protein
MAFFNHRKAKTSFDKYFFLAEFFRADLAEDLLDNFKAVLPFLIRNSSYAKAQAGISFLGVISVKCLDGVGRRKVSFEIQHTQQKPTSPPSSPKKTKGKIIKSH